MCLGDGLDIKEARVVQNTKAENPLFHFLSSYILGTKVSPVKNMRRMIKWAVTFTIKGIQRCVSTHHILEDDLCWPG